MNPILMIETITTSRRIRYFVLRSIYAGVLLAMFAFAYQAFEVRSRFVASQGVNSQGAANVTRMFFQQFTAVQLTAILLLAPAIMAGTIAGEVERKTLDYTLVLPLSSRSILLGKLSSRLLLSLLLIAAGAPVLAVTMMLGGIPPLRMLTVFVTAFSTLFTVGALSLGVSVWSMRTRDAMLRSYILILGWLFLPVILESMRFSGWSWLQGTFGELSKRLLALNPYVVSYTEDLGSLAVATLVNVLFGAGVLSYAAWRMRPMIASRSGKLARQRRLNPLRSRPAPYQNAMLWKEMYVEARALQWGWLARGVIAVMLVFLAVMSFYNLTSWRAQGPDRGVYFFVMYGGLASLALLLAGTRAATSITGEQERDSWLTLLSTPLSSREIVVAKLLGNLYAMRWTLAVALLHLFLGYYLVPDGLLSLPFVLLSLVATLVFCTLLGLRYSLMSSGSTGAIWKTLGTLLFMGGGYLFCCGSIVALVFINVAPGADKLMAFALSSCMPMLLVYPAVAPDSWFENEVTGAWVVGVTGYVFASVMLYGNLLVKFDLRTGRLSQATREQDQAPFAEARSAATAVESIMPRESGEIPPSVELAD